MTSLHLKIENNIDQIALTVNTRVSATPLAFVLQLLVAAVTWI